MPRRRLRSNKAPQEERQPAAARPFWSGTITFGLVSIPVDLFPAIRTARPGLRMLSPDGVPLSRRYYSAETNKELDDDKMVRGYEIQKDKYVIVTDDELERLEPEKARDIDLRLFVNADEIEPIYFERAYFLAPGEGSGKAYRLLAEMMESKGRAGIATFVMRGKEYLVAILAENGMLRAETMRFSDEVRSPREAGLPEPESAAKAAVTRFQKIIRNKSADDLSVEELRDQETEALTELVRKKLARRKDVLEVEVTGRRPEKVVDLMEILKRSLEGERPKREAGKKAA